MKVPEKLSEQKFIEHVLPTAIKEQPFDSKYFVLDRAT